MSKVPSMQELLEAGVHFGHQVRRWNPKMQPYIFTAREGIHVIDLGQTVVKLEEACDFVRKMAEEGGKVIFLASKKQAKDIILEQAQASGAFYVNDRWIGGLLTNWDQTSKTIKHLADLKAKKESGAFSDRTKKENLMIDRDIAKLERLYGGVSTIEKLPEALFVVDVKKEENACREAKLRGIPVIAICDTNTNTSLVDYPIPGNDDATRAIAIVVEAIAAAYKEGREAFEKSSAKEKVEAEKKAVRDAAEAEKQAAEDAKKAAAEAKKAAAKPEGATAVS